MSRTGQSEHRLCWLHWAPNGGLRFSCNGGLIWARGAVGLAGILGPLFRAECFSSLPFALAISRGPLSPRSAQGSSSHRGALLALPWSLSRLSTSLSASHHESGDPCSPASRGAQWALSPRIHLSNIQSSAQIWLWEIPGKAGL